MPRLKSLGSGLTRLPSALKGAPAPEANYGQGRGGRPWRRLRQQVLDRDKYLCQPCLSTGRYTEAVEVDHITPQAEGGSDDPVNLQAICKPCHEAKTEQEAKRGAARCKTR